MIISKDMAVSWNNEKLENSTKSWCKMNAIVPKYQYLFGLVDKLGVYPHLGEYVL